MTTEDLKLLQDKNQINPLTGLPYTTLEGVTPLSTIDSPQSVLTPTLPLEGAALNSALTPDMAPTLSVLPATPSLSSESASNTPLSGISTPIEGLPSSNNALGSAVLDTSTATNGVDTANTIDSLLRQRSKVQATAAKPPALTPNLNTPDLQAGVEPANPDIPQPVDESEIAPIVAQIPVEKPPQAAPEPTASTNLAAPIEAVTAPLPQVEAAKPIVEVVLPPIETPITEVAAALPAQPAIQEIPSTPHIVEETAIDTATESLLAPSKEHVKPTELAPHLVAAGEPASNKILESLEKEHPGHAQVSGGEVRLTGAFGSNSDALFPGIHPPSFNKFQKTRADRRFKQGVYSNEDKAPKIKFDLSGIAANFMSLLGRKKHEEPAAESIAA